MIATTLEQLIEIAKRNLDRARSTGDPLWTDLAEAALNDLIDRYAVTVVTRNNQKGEK